MEYTTTKPRLLFFQYKYDGRLPAFVLTHTREHVKCLSQFFEVTVVNEDSDYQQMCDRYEPDLTVVESSFTVSHCHRPRVTNTRACPQVPKLGFLHSDAFSQGRAGFISDMNHWGIDTFFTISVTAAEHTPAIAHNLFIWPNFVDPTMFRDYQQWKSIPVLFTGNSSNLYPWRQNIIRLVSKRYPSLICPHPGGYDPQKEPVQVMSGEPYARMLNASCFVPACGTVARDVVRKHFEVPASKACLIAEKSPALEAAGFVDMKNCIFADEHDVLDKLNRLFRHRDELEAITNAGYELVHSRHTIRHRDQILQWLTLRKNLQPHQEIVQTGPFEPLHIADRSAVTFNSQLDSHGAHLTLLRLGDKKLAQGRYDEAESAYYKCLSYIPWMPEPQLRLGLCNLYKGDAKKAASWVLEPLQFTLAEYKADDPDPVEWAYFIVSLVCQGKVEDAVKRSRQFPWLRHPELDRARWVANALCGQVPYAPAIDDEAPSPRPSIHQLPSQSFREWVQQLSCMLKACHQDRLADRLTNFPALSASCSADEQRTGTAGDPVAGHAKGDIHESRPVRARYVLGESGSVSFIKRRLFYAKVKVAAKQRLSANLHRLEARWGAFLPYRVSGRRCDAFFSAIEELARKEHIRTALVIGADPREASTEALLAGAMENKSGPAVFCISNLSHRLIAQRTTNASDVVAGWYEISSPSDEEQAGALDEIINNIKEENQIEFFDVVLVDGSQTEHQVCICKNVARELRAARFVILDGISNRGNHEAHRLLVGNQRFALTDYDPTLRGGYSIFETLESTDVDGSGVNCRSTVVGARSD